MNNLNKSVIKLTSAVLSVSIASTVNRYRNEYKRRTGLNGNEFLKDNDGNTIEYNLDLNENSNILIVFENGLGTPLESWDYVKLFLKGSYNLLFYNRPKHGFTSTNLSNCGALEKIVKEKVGNDIRIIFVCHSIGALAGCTAVENSPYIKSRTEKIILVDGTEPDLFEAYRNDSEQKGEFMQMCFQKAMAGFFGFQWWGIDKYARRTSYRPDIQESVRLFEANPKEIFITLSEYFNIRVDSLKSILMQQQVAVSIISSFERRTQQKKLAEDFGIPFSLIDKSTHYSIIGHPEFAWELTREVRNVLEK